jgi:hypothetical protein
MKKENIVSELIPNWNMPEMIHEEENYSVKM